MKYLSPASYHNAEKTKASLALDVIEMGKNEKELLQEMAKWLKFMGMQEARSVVENAVTFEDEKKERAAKITYQLTNGDNTSSDIENYIPYSSRWVRTRQNEWAKLGIVDKEGRQDPYKHILSLDALGIDAPEIPSGEDTGMDETSVEEAEG